MRKLHIEDAAVTRIAIQHEIGRTEESRYGHRLHGLLLLAAGHSCQQVAALFGEDDTTVQRWVKRFMQGGLTALREGQRTGRPPTLAPQQWSRLEADLRSDPRDFGFAAVCWDGPTLCKLLRLRYGVELGVRQCQRIFQQIRFGQRGTEYRAPDSAPPHHSEMTAGMSIGTAD